MANPFLNILNNPATGINVQLNKHEQSLFLKAIEEKVTNAITEHKNVESHDNVYTPLNDWLWWLNNMWDGNMDYRFESQASNIGLTPYELYKVVVGILLERTHKLEHKIIDAIEIGKCGMGEPIDCTPTDIDDNAYIINDPNSKYDCQGKLDK